MSPPNPREVFVVDTNRVVTPPGGDPGNSLVPVTSGGQRGGQRIQGGSLVRATPLTGPRTDPGFFRKLITRLNPLRQQIRYALGSTGVRAALALDVAATANLGNPFLFADRRETWKEMSGRLEGTRTDVWRSYFTQIAPHWSGAANGVLEGHIRFNVNGLYNELGKISDQSSSTMQNLYKEVLEYDLSVFGFYASTAAVVKPLLAASTHPVGRTTLIGVGLAFASTLGNLVKQYADVYNVYTGDLNQLELQLNTLRATYYNGGDLGRGPRDLDLSPSIEAPGNPGQYWKPVPQA